VTLYESGRRLSEGRATPQSLRKARECFRQAADAGSVDAMVAFADAQKGLNPPSWAHVAEYYGRAAREGHVRAMYGHAKCLEDGTGVKANPGEALRWYTSAASRGQADAQARLGRVYERGLMGAAVDLGKCWQYYKSSADQGNADGQFLFGRILERHGRNDQQAVQMYRLAAQQLHARAHGRLAKLHALGRCGLAKNFAEAKSHFISQAKLGEMDRAYYTIGCMAMNGVEGAGGKDHAIKEFGKAAELGHTKSVLKLADLLEEVGKRQEAGIALKRFWETYWDEEVEVRHHILCWENGTQRGKQRAAGKLKEAAEWGCQRAIDFRRMKGIR
jgi:TPR repeat protein